MVRRIQRKGRLSAIVRTKTAAGCATALQVDLLYILVASDLNPFMQSRIPARCPPPGAATTRR